MSSNLEKGLYSVLTAPSPQTSAAGRVYPRLPQGVTLPAVRYQLISVERIRAIDPGRVGVTSATVQVDCIAEAYSECKTLADEVRAILDEYQGAWGALACRLCTLETENDLEYIDGDEARHWVAQRYRISTDMD